MCPFCLASIGLILASATSAGGLTALAVKLSQKKNLGQEVTATHGCGLHLQPALKTESSMTGQDCRIDPAGIASEQADVR